MLCAPVLHPAILILCGGLAMPKGFEHRREALVGLIYDAVLDARLERGAGSIADMTDSAAALIHGYSVRS